MGLSGFLGQCPHHTGSAGPTCSCKGLGAAGPSSARGPQCVQEEQNPAHLDGCLGVIAVARMHLSCCSHPWSHVTCGSHNISWMGGTLGGGRCSSAPLKPHRAAGLWLELWEQRADVGVSQTLSENLKPRGRASDSKEGPTDPRQQLQTPSEGPRPQIRASDPKQEPKTPSKGLRSQVRTSNPKEKPQIPSTDPTPQARIPRSRARASDPKQGLQIPSKNLRSQTRAPDPSQKPQIQRQNPKSQQPQQPQLPPNNQPHVAQSSPDDLIGKETSSAHHEVSHSWLQHRPTAELCRTHNPQSPAAGP